MRMDVDEARQQDRIAELHDLTTVGRLYRELRPDRSDPSPAIHQQCTSSQRT
jgi:hypothetical protein